MIDYVAIFGIVFVINVVPAFAPPTWAVLILLRLQTGVPSAAIVLTGSLAAGLGRLTLAVGTRRLRDHLPAKTVDNLDAGRELLTSGRTRGLAMLGLFAVSPEPSAQLFEGAGLLDVPLVRFTVAFFAGRIISYSVYVGLASLATHSFATLIQQTLLSPYGVLLQLASILGLVALTRIDWPRLAARLGRRHGPNATSHRTPDAWSAHRDGALPGLMEDRRGRQRTTILVPTEKAVAPADGHADHDHGRCSGRRGQRGTRAWVARNRRAHPPGHRCLPPRGARCAGPTHGGRLQSRPSADESPQSEVATSRGWRRLPRPHRGHTPRRPAAPMGGSRP